jgi:transcriptional regulator with XRE-family HTH domain
MLPAGKSLRTLREKLGLTMRDIELSSARMAEKYRNEEFSIPPSRLSDIETKGVLPSIFRLYTLAVIYRRDLRSAAIACLRGLVRTIVRAGADPHGSWL